MLQLVLPLIRITCIVCLTLAQFNKADFAGKQAIRLKGTSYLPTRFPMLPDHMAKNGKFFLKVPNDYTS